MRMGFPWFGIGFDSEGGPGKFSSMKRFQDSRVSLERELLRLSSQVPQIMMGNGPGKRKSSRKWPAYE